MVSGASVSRLPLPPGGLVRRMICVLDVPELSHQQHQLIGRGDVFEGGISLCAREGGRIVSLRI